MFFLTNKSEIIPIDTHSKANLLSLAILKKIQNLYEKPIYLFYKNPDFERFENSYYFSRILRKLCYNLMEKKSDT